MPLYCIKNVHEKKLKFSWKNILIFAHEQNTKTYHNKNSKKQKSFIVSMDSYWTPAPMFITLYSLLIGIISTERSIK